MMEDVESKLRACFSVIADEPRTLAEIRESLPGGVSATSKEAVTQALQRLVERGELVSRHLCEDCVLFWAPAAAGSVSTEKQRPSSTAPVDTTPLPLVRSSRKTRLPFKSPAISGGARCAAPTTPGRRGTTAAGASLPPRSVGTATENLDRLTTQVSQLKTRLEDVNTEITLLSANYNSEELQLYIDGLHEYNEMKDAGQMLLGQLAVQEGTTTTALYGRFGLDIED